MPGTLSKFDLQITCEEAFEEEFDDIPLEDSIDLEDCDLGELIGLAKGTARPL